ncbi:hypothetical protein [Marivita sp. GX14005]|uniref:hypothetical protein n=1 Tax=Marivita sp. GX14005 TaxID=2942276 RepID=UPI00201922FB|nr:hypothetical protein [Marivita sp. GX14005]MCL3881557.1 hypothetical protein [Marivita sp. GX14005]
MIRSNFDQTLGLSGTSLIYKRLNMTSPGIEAGSQTMTEHAVSSARIRDFGDSALGSVAR